MVGLVYRCMGIGRPFFVAIIHSLIHEEARVRFLTLVLVGLVLGCGDARTELADRGIAYTKGAFSKAAESGDLAVVKLFVESGMSVHTPDNDYGLTVLHFAAWKGHLEVVEYLVGQGADVNAKTDDGDTVLHFAAWDGHTDVVRYLVGQGGGRERKDRQGGLVGSVRGGGVWSFGGGSVFG